MNIKPTRTEELTHWITTGNWTCIASCLSGRTPDQYDAQAHLAKGLLLTYGPDKYRNLDNAVLSLESACKLEPNEAQHLSTLAEVLLQVKQPRRSLNAAQRARATDPKNAMAAVVLGRAAWACRNRMLAYQSFLDASHLLPKDSSPVRRQVNTMTFKLAPFWWAPLKGKGVTLVRMDTTHHDFVLQCRNNISFQSHYNVFQEKSSEAVMEELKLSNRPPLDSNKIEWVVEKNGSPIGLATLADLDIRNSRAEMLIGFPENPTALNKVESTLLVLEFAFSTLGLSKVYNYIYSNNPHGQRCSMHLGFNQEGFLQSHVRDPASNSRLDLYVNGGFPEMLFENTSTIKLFQRVLGRLPQKN